VAYIHPGNRDRPVRGSARGGLIVPCSGVFCLGQGEVSGAFKVSEARLGLFLPGTPPRRGLGAFEWAGGVRSLMPSRRGLGAFVRAGCAFIDAPETGAGSF